MEQGETRIKIAIQKSGRLTSDSLDLLRACGLELDGQKQTLYTPCRNFPLDLLALRDDDIPQYVHDGVADLGIVGENTVLEKGLRVERVLDLGFGVCRLMICLPQHSEVRTLRDLEGRRLATTYPTITGRFLEAEGIRCEVVRLSGAVEIAPMLDIADAICDLVSTGTTARVNGLYPAFTVLTSQARLIASEGLLADPAKRQLFERLMIRIQGSLEARGRRYLMMNAPCDAVDELRAIIPALKSPTVVPLAEEGMVAVHSVIAEDAFWDVMEKLKGVGASDIVVVPIEAIIR
ncbi:MAG TPA: ATP phosphoribosyltransferase [Candidatus Kapabacteria bacterium]|nr:ATP phosphoribosyltransferase [Candidatus Kapabacteria bacterium]